ncbi:VOC family protein [Sporosarcina pasteurii]|uniref:Glyoxalase-like domain n=1 Tax=Sporosarcina pasteurii TaxID=1474 RepID=A0A380CLH4_SPOPA|nr:VOC family protein [Sporosarcina pasteurii]MDS9471910.1 glyoxalase [Sporosarcina pasteurii]QBQ06643.1 glyoxalase [Sporosarcina pasteurii]SUJ21953.1 Glyoxalase-like domain [Sporosarcina pasteurii]
MSTFLTGIDHIQIASPPDSEDTARKFYGELLSMEEISKPPNLQGRGGCWFICGSQEVHIGIQKDFVAAKKAHPGFTVHALEELKLRLAEAGYAIHEEAPIDGRSRFFTNDPFGNRIEFLEFE